MKYFILILLLSISHQAANAERLHLSIRYLGIKVADVKISDKQNLLHVHAKATGIAGFASSMDNTYSSYYKADYLPETYRKEINQKNYSESRLIYFDRSSLIARRISNISTNRNKEYPILPESRDFFSGLYYIRNNLENPGSIILDANGLIWEAQYKVSEKEIISSQLGRQEVYKVEIRFYQLSSDKKERSDILTNNLVHEDNELSLWITSDDRRIPLRARYNRKPFPVYWQLESYEK